MLLAMLGVTHVACAFDHVIESFRNDLFADYKTSEASTRICWPSSRSPRKPFRRLASSSGRWSNLKPTML